MCLTSSKSSSSFFYAFDRRVSALFFSFVCHSVGLTLFTLWASIWSIFCFLAFDLARAAYFYSSRRLFSCDNYSLVLMTVAPLILSRSDLLMITASFWLFFSVFDLMVLSSSRLTTAAFGPIPLLPALPVPLPPKRVSSTYESAFCDLLLALDPNCDYKT